MTLAWGVTHLGAGPLHLSEHLAVEETEDESHEEALKDIALRYSDANLE